MKGSSNSGWENSDSSRRLNDNIVSRGRLGLLHCNRLGDSGDGSHNARCVQGGNERDLVRLPYTDDLDHQVGSSAVWRDKVAVGSVVRAVECGEISLRQWLDTPERSVDHLECFHIFRQIVEIVNLAHSRGIVVHNVRPSCLFMSAFNRIFFIESASFSSLGSDSYGDALNNRAVEGQGNFSPSPHELQKQSGDFSLEMSPADASQRERAYGISCLGSSFTYAMHQSSIEGAEEGKFEDGSRNVEEVEELKKNFPLEHILLMEPIWYTSPEEDGGVPSSFSSDIYRLGVLLFELFCTFSSTEEKLNTMSNLRHRVLPPQLLLKWPKEASFCLWLLHPQPSTRPKMSEVLKSEFLNEPRDNLEEREAAIKLREEIEEQELLLEFLLQMQQRKKEASDKLHNTIRCLSSDIEEVLKQQSILKEKGGSYPELNKDNHSVLENEDHPSLNLVRNDDLVCRKHFRSGLQMCGEEEFDKCTGNVEKSETQTENLDSILSKSSRLMKNFKKLESAYFSTRCRLMKPTEKLLNRNSQISINSRGSVVLTEGSSVNNLGSNEDHATGRKSGWINPFLEGLCKYLSFSKLKVRADLKQGDLLNSSNLVCSLSFDRDKEFFATAGVNRKIKIFECDMILNEDRDIHYPVIEMAARSKLSSICWNSYIKSQIASSDFEGVVQVWDITRGQVFMELREHERRVWSVDFSSADPTKLASGSDDGAVKLWNTNQGGSVGTIKTKANVCCVQFPPDSARSLAFGSADHMIYCYDLRNTSIPLCTLIGHTRTVSYVKFIDPMTLVSASTDNSLKLWDLSMCTSRVLDSPLQTFTGHTNVKNFVGLSIFDDYIATGSETNEVFVYHKAFPMPVLAFKFSSADSHSGDEVDDATQFISSLCWRGKSSTLVAANSTGNIKLLEMV